MAKLSRQERKQARLQGIKFIKPKEPDTGRDQKQDTAKAEKTGFKEFYAKNYRKLMIIPFAILIIAVCLVGYQYLTTGDFIYKGVSLKGGITVTVPIETAVDIAELEDYLKSTIGYGDLTVRSQTSAGKHLGIIIDASDIESSVIIDFIETKLGKQLTPEDYSVQEIGTSLGKSFFKEMILALVFAFIFMSIVVFLYFRSFIPSIAVILAAFTDMIVALAVVNLLEVKLSIAGVAAFLMLIGFSVDTDILLTSRVLKEKEGTVTDRIFNALGTGLTMTFTAIGAIVIALIFSQSDTINQIMLVLLIGLVMDIISTWLQNTGILMWFLERKKNE